MRLLMLILVVMCLMPIAPAQAEKITIAAAADLKFALDEIVAGFRKSHPADEIQVSYGSSGKFQTQIQQGAPYDLFFSADISFPRQLARLGLAASEVKPYAVGRIVLWSAGQDAAKITLASLADPRFKRIAIANPKHAPYGKRAEEALRAAGVWESVRSRLVLGESVAQAAQFVQSGNAQAGIIALSLALSPELTKKGGYVLIPDTLHQPLEQGYIITRRGGEKTLAATFSDYMDSKPARGIMTKYGFVLPGQQAGK